MRMKQIVLLAALAGSLLLRGAGLIRAQAGPGIGWSAIAGGGGQATIGAVTLDSAIGQWTASVGPQISSGFLPGAASAPAVRQLRYLPLVLKQ
jgi:hypothetical protein